MADTEPLVLEHLREEYRLAEFNETTCEEDPIRQFRQWFADAKAAILKEPNAMALATATPDGKPSNRIVSLEEKLTNLEAKYVGTDDVPTPDYWGGYSVVPETIEFWQGRANRLHDRLLYSRRQGSDWRIERLSP